MTNQLYPGHSLDDGSGPFGRRRRGMPQFPGLGPMPQKQNGGNYGPGIPSAAPIQQVPQQQTLLGPGLGLLAMAMASDQDSPDIKWNKPPDAPSQPLAPEMVPQFTPEQLASLQNQSPPDWFSRNFLGAGGFGGGGGGPAPQSQSQRQRRPRGLLDMMLYGEGS
jgi:hypothetical protein